MATVLQCIYTFNLDLEEIAQQNDMSSDDIYDHINSNNLDVFLEYLREFYRPVKVSFIDDSLIAIFEIDINQLQSIAPSNSPKENMIKHFYDNLSVVLNIYKSEFEPDKSEQRIVDIF